MKAITVQDWINIKNSEGYTFSLTITEELHKSFADISGSLQEFHHNDEVARELGYRERISYGLIPQLMVVAFIEKEIYGANSVGYEWATQFYKPLYIGDVLTFFVNIVDVRKSTRSCVTEVVVKNQDREIVTKIMVKCKMKAGVKNEDYS